MVLFKFINFCSFIRLLFFFDKLIKPLFATFVGTIRFGRILVDFILVPINQTVQQFSISEYSQLLLYPMEIFMFTNSTKSLFLCQIGVARVTLTLSIIEPSSMLAFICFCYSTLQVVTLVAHALSVMLAKFVFTINICILNS